MMAGITRREWVKRGAMAGVGMVTAAAMPCLGQAAGTPGSEKTGVGAGSLKEHAEAKRLPVGAAVNMALLRGDETYRRVLAEQYNMVVGENCMKWAALRPTAETFKFDEADELVSFAEQHGMQVRGHNLCWHEQLPAWFAGAVTKENAAKVLTDHIATVAGRYKGRIHSWDVVNEAVWMKDGRPDGMRSSSPWYELLGPAYLEVAFRAARAADPGALLTYNEYGIEYDEPEEQGKRAAVMALLKRLRETKGPGGRPLVDAVGVQSHLKTANIAKLGEGIREFAGKARKMGLQVFVTELDVDDDSLPDEEALQQDRDVATVYGHYLAQMLQERSVTAVLTWGLADGQSWLQGEKSRVKHPQRMQRPLPFLVDENGTYRAKPAYFAMRDAVDGAKRR